MLRLRAALGFALCLASHPALALDPARGAAQYFVRNWGSEDNLPQDTVQAIAQTPDGYLWLGTMGGLVRFDGVRFTTFTRKNSDLPHDNVWALRLDRRGRLWVSTDGGGAAIWEDG